MIKPIFFINKIFYFFWRFITNGFTKQNFLGNPLIPILLKICPKKYRKNLALKFIGISPHYFIYLSSLSKTIPYINKLKLEHQRNKISRKILCEQILKKYFQSQMTVLDFGCGPGYLAKNASKYVKKVIAVDISCGIIACAKEINNSSNIIYLVNKEDNLSIIKNASLDLIYSFAVIQHLSGKLFEYFLMEFFRILKPGGKIICHIALNNKMPTKQKNIKPVNNSFLDKRFHFRMLYRSAADVTNKIESSGFINIKCEQINKLSNVNDDIVNEHLFIFNKPDQ